MRRRPLRVAGAVLGVALAVALIGSLGAFFGATKARMTERAATGVPVDWQVQLAPRTLPAEAARTIAAAPGVLRSAQVGFGQTTGFRSNTGGTVQTTGSGVVLGVPAGYASAFPGEIRFLMGAHEGVLLAQQTAANLHASVGDMVAVSRPTLSPLPVRVDGIVDLPAADSLFQSVGAPPGTGHTAPPDNVMLLPEADWHRAFDPVASAAPAAVLLQFHVDLSLHLPPDPGRAFTDVTARARNLEAQLAGGGLVGDNLAARLDSARSDAAYAQLLFLFLGIPGAFLAGLLTFVIGAAGGDRRRRELALLRIRGATPSRILRMAGAEALLVAVVGVAAGLGGGALAGRLAFGSPRFGGTTHQALAWGVAAALSGLVLALLSILIPAWRDLRAATVMQARLTVGAAPRPLWARLYLDVALLGAAGLVYWQAVRSGYQVVLAPEGIPTISVSTVTFLAPLFLWIGAALFAWRLSTGALSRGRRAIARLARPLAHGLAGVVSASMSRQRRLLSRGLMILALTVSFAVSTALFNATYASQSRVDAELTTGADVAVTTAAESGLPAGLAGAVRGLPGVIAAEAMQHRFAYVGADLQDLYGIDPRTIGRATPMSDAFFGGGHATDVLATLAAYPDGILVSDETVHDFQLRSGDLVRLRLLFARDHAYHVLPFHYVGIVREFPTAPTDSFIVANAAYVAERTGSSSAGTLLVKTFASPPTVAAEVRRVLGPASGATVQDVVGQLRVTRSGLTAIDLAGLTRLELGFSFVLAGAASGLVLALGLAERRRAFAIASALGARSRQLAAFVWSEAAYVSVGGAAVGILLGWGLAFVLVKILTGVFDPPPTGLSVPWTYLGMVGLFTLAAIVAAGAWTVRATRRPAIEVVRDL